MRSFSHTCAQKRVELPIFYLSWIDSDTINDTNSIMAKVDEILSSMRRNPDNVRFSELGKVCDHYFGTPRQKGTSHRVYKTPWAGDPRVNIQNNKGKAKGYQVRQVLAAIDKLGGGQNV
jgi:hypothetical protein